jgi:small subunit ribosomal protein S21
MKVSFSFTLCIRLLIARRLGRGATLDNQPSPRKTTVSTNDFKDSNILPANPVAKIPRIRLVSHFPSTILGIKVKVAVRDGKIEQALRVLKRKMQAEGIYREMRENEYFEKPSEKRKRREAEARRRHLKDLRKRADIDFGRAKKSR